MPEWSKAQRNYVWVENEACQIDKAHKNFEGNSLSIHWI